MEGRLESWHLSQGIVIRDLVDRDAMLFQTFENDDCPRRKHRGEEGRLAFVISLSSCVADVSILLTSERHSE